MPAAMPNVPSHSRDPIGWSIALTLVFLALVAIRLTIPTKLYFDEVHYVPAARMLLTLAEPANREHPMLGKEFIAAGIALFGDKPLGWRIFPAIAGALALFAFLRAMWFASARRFATLAAGFFMATGFFLFVHARIAMLDIFMVAFAMIALWQCAGAVREPETGRWRLALAGVALGLGIGSKWNAVPVALLPGLAFLVVRIRATGWRFALTARGAPVPGISLIEAACWLGVVPLALYAMTFMPAFFYAKNALSPSGLIAFHHTMLTLQDGVVKPHPYQSVWWQWVTNWRAIWYLYENVDGAQRGVVLIGNPFSVLAGLPALGWCVWVGAKHGRRDALAVAVLYFATLGLWFASGKPVQFLYHYFLPSCFLYGALGLAMDAAWQRGYRWVTWGTMGLTLAMAVYFYPILSSAALSGPKGFEFYTWLPSWR